MLLDRYLAKEILLPFVAAVLFLTATLHSTAAGLRAIIAPFYDRILEEYRIGFTVKDSDEVVHGVIWPLVGAEDELTETAEQISTVLREAGMTEITMLEQRLPLEYCDDCGAPLFPNPDGEPVHAELPDSATEVHTPLQTGVVKVAGGKDGAIAWKTISTAWRPWA